MTRRILFFINPISGTKSKLNLEKKIIQKCGKRNISFEILFTSKEGNYNFLHDKIEKENITDIVICGGDGSIGPIVSATLNIEVNIGLIPLGSGNGLARTAGIPGSVNKAIDLIFERKAIDTDAFLINNTLSTHISGLGFDAKVADEFSKKTKRGLQAYTKISLKNFYTAPVYPFTIDADGNQFKVDAFMICIANSNQFGNNFKIAPKASICDGLLDLVVLKKTGKPQIVLSFIRQLVSGNIQSVSAKNIYGKNILYFQNKKIKIGNPQLAPLHIDGNPVETGESFSIEVLPSAYKLIRP